MDIKICDFCSEPYTRSSFSFRIADERESIDLYGHDECVNAAHDKFKEGKFKKKNMKQTMKELGIEK